MNPGRLYTIRILSAGFVYAITLIPAFTVLRSLPEGSLWRIPLALLPLPAILFGLWTFLQFLASMDELQRKIQLQAIGFSVGLTGVITFTLGLLESAGFPTLSLIWVFPMIIALWGIGQAIATRRYQ